MSRIYHEYTCKKTSQSSDHEMSNHKPSAPARSWSRAEPRCKSRLSQLDPGSEHDGLGQNPKIETCIECGVLPEDGNGMVEGMGIMKTVDVDVSSYVSPSK